MPDLPLSLVWLGSLGRGHCQDASWQTAPAVFGIRTRLPVAPCSSRVAARCWDKGSSRPLARARSLACQTSAPWQRQSECGTHTAARTRHCAVASAQPGHRSSEGARFGWPASLAFWCGSARGRACPRHHLRWHHQCRHRHGRQSLHLPSHTPDRGCPAQGHPRPQQPQAACAAFCSAAPSAPQALARVPLAFQEEGGPFHPRTEIHGAWLPPASPSCRDAVCLLSLCHDPVLVLHSP
mmetsp:Transcript_43915/g.103893  ORF Transcript_43915/g.103893 Transcript_43915/m.103893 type:complete len:238 (+) Transcript_43915:682-1395(+)